ncbi:MAG: hypothetical protein QOC67_3568 [Pseudonocardiales bacterium]|jgi:hypothetical protein|nr:hypothetical protein [Pseudonocardiales bacterium]MDT7749054.1 hypothetical protein [Pseudonocardiales bacterium]MDT7774644.1 hypothetical protein [Pseudonocardiales bacterium]
MTTRLERPNIESPEERQLQQQLAELESRLLAQYVDQGVSENRVRTTLERVLARFAGARVRTFLPILVERAARRELTS